MQHKPGGFSRACLHSPVRSCAHVEPLPKPTARGVFNLNFLVSEDLLKNAKPKGSFAFQVDAKADIEARP